MLENSHSVRVIIVRIFILVLSVLGLLFEMDVFADESITIPKPKVLNLKKSSIKLGPKTKIDANDSLRVKFKSSFRSVENVIEGLPTAGKNLTITIKLLSEVNKNKIKENALSALKHKEAYWIEISESDITIVGADPQGALHGVTTLEEKLSEDSGRLYEGNVLDWPDHDIRAVHLAVQTVRPAEIKKLVKLSRFGHFNTVILQLADGVRLGKMEVIARDNAWTTDEFLDVVNFARENGLEVVPEVKLLTHQEKLLKDKYPDLMFNKVTYDPRKDKTYSTVLPMVDEVIALIKPKRFHIGHDEVGGFNAISKEKWLDKNENVLPSELFIRDIERIHKHLKELGIDIWMWGDMLISPEEFPNMFPNYLHGLNGYSKIRSKVPSDIVICDWHYIDSQAEFPSAMQFAKEGRRVLGATWKNEKTTRNFSRYLANMPRGGEGMIATTWFHVQRKQWEIVTEIIRVSGEAFWNAK